MISFFEQNLIVEFNHYLLVFLLCVVYYNSEYLVFETLFCFIFSNLVVVPLAQTMTTFMPPPPAATFLAFHPQDNNIIAIGMEDSSIQIYNVRVDEVRIMLKYL